MKTRKKDKAREELEKLKPRIRKHALQEQAREEKLASKFARRDLFI